MEKDAAQATAPRADAVVYTVTLKDHTLSVEAHGPSGAAVAAPMVSFASVMAILLVLAWIGLGRVVEAALNVLCELLLRKEGRKTPTTNEPVPDEGNAP